MQMAEPIELIIPFNSLCRPASSPSISPWSGENLCIRDLKIDNIAQSGSKSSYGGACHGVCKKSTHRARPWGGARRSRLGSHALVAWASHHKLTRPRLSRGAQPRASLRPRWPPYTSPLQDESQHVCCGARHRRFASPGLSLFSEEKPFVLLPVSARSGAHLRRLGSQAVGPGRNGLRAAVVPSEALRESPLLYASLSSRGRTFLLLAPPCHEAEIPGSSRPRCGVERATSAASSTQTRQVPGPRLPCWLRWKGCYAQGWVPALTPSCCRWGHVSCPLGCCRGATQLLLTQGAGLAHRLQKGKSACAVPTPRPGAS